MNISDEELEKILGETNLVKIISEFTVLKKDGRGYSGKCPFPDHKSFGRTLSVSLRHQVYHCFDCKRSGNAITFLQQFAGMTFPEAVKFLLEKGKPAV